MVFGKSALLRWMRGAETDGKPFLHIDFIRKILYLTIVLGGLYLI